MAVFFLLVPSAILLGIHRDWKIAFTALTFALCGLYGGVVFFRLFSVFIGMIRRSEHRITPEEVAALRNEDLPVYTVLVPMFREPEVAQKIARTVTSLDYPIDKLDVKLLLEEKDAETRAKIEEVIHTLPPCLEVFVAPAVPKGQPQTKPRACNWGLERAKGKYLVIFDAEDQPEPDQLKKAVVAFQKLEAGGKKKVVCLQAKLNYFNARENWLSRFFTLEYTTWFDLFLPGLHAARTPIPLGGTSNHFHTETLKEIGGWDPFNVTEDCDLGIRLARRGLSTEILDSTTWEEANCTSVNNWIKQRSRWIKGYFQTHLVHTRDAVVPLLALAAVFFFLHKVAGEDLQDPRMRERLLSLYGQPAIDHIGKFQTLCLVLASIAGISAAYSAFQQLRKRLKGKDGRQMGPYAATTFRFTVGGMSAMLLLNLIFWVMTATYLLRKPIAENLPRSIAQMPVDDSTVKQTLLDWQLYYTRTIDDDRYGGITLWNTLGGYATSSLKWSDVKDRIAKIDDWSLISQVFYPVAIMLFAANFVIVLLGLVSCSKRNLWDLFPFALLMPFYWILISLAAIKGFFQLFTNPWYWEKTSHGHSGAEPQKPIDSPKIEAIGSVSGV